MPDLAELLHDLWDGTREDLSSHITGSDRNYTLDLSEDALQTALEHVAERLVQDSDAWQTASSPRSAIRTTWCWPARGTRLC